MSPPIPIDLPPVEHHYTLDQYGRPIEVQSVIYIPPNNPQQLNQDGLMADYQLDLFFDLLYAVEDHDIKRIIKIIDALPQSFRKQTKKLFAEISEMKKRNFDLEQKNMELQQQINDLYDFLQLKKKGIYDL